MIQKVALIGMGAIGAFFAPRLYETLGEDFWLIAAGERKKRLSTRGVTLNGINYRFPIHEPSDKQKADLVIIATKEMGLDSALEDVKNCVGPNTLILPILNGIESEERTAAVYGWERVLYSYMRIPIVMKDGCADFDPNGGYVFFGEKKNEVLSPRVQAVDEVMTRCGIPHQIPEDMIHGIWFKFMTNIGENMTCALLGVPYGAFRSSEDADFIRVEAMKEVAAIAAKKGIKLGEKEFDKLKELLKTAPAANKPSTLQDIEAGRPTEVAMFSGTVMRLGKELDVPTPVNALLYHGIRVLEEKNAGQIAGM